jgi:hypothetical protein
VSDDTTPKRRPARKRTAPKPAPDAGSDQGTEDTPKPPPRRRRAGNTRNLQLAIQENYVLVGMVLYGAGAARQSPQLSQVGMGFVQQSEVLAEQWLKVADQYPSVRTALERATTASAVGALVGTHVAICAPAVEQMVPEGLRPAFAQMGMMVNNTPTPPPDN